MDKAFQQSWNDFMCMEDIEERVIGRQRMDGWMDVFLWARLFTAEDKHKYELGKDKEEFGVESYGGIGSICTNKLTIPTCVF